MNSTPIQWTWSRGADGELVPMSGSTWNPALGCRRVSTGCEHCYAERLIAVRMSRNPRLPMYHDIARVTDKGEPRFTGAHRLLPDRLDEPLRARKGRKIFVCDMGDLFFEGHTFEEIAAVWGVMAAAPQHTFQVLTKRPERALEFLLWSDSRPGTPGTGGRWHPMGYCVDAARAAGVDHQNLSPEELYLRRPVGGSLPWPLSNVHVGVSVEDQSAADKRIPVLLQIPAALRFLSCEPLLSPVNIEHAACSCPWPEDAARTRHLLSCPCSGRKVSVDWVIGGGESGLGARPCDLAWLRSLRDQCMAANVPFFCKQLGAEACVHVHGVHRERVAVRLKDKHGGNMAEWPEDLRVRETPR